MPTYEYACKGKCGEHHEVHQKFTDPPLEACPTCGGAVRKVFGNIGISFKGSGFYKTDSRKATSAAKTSSSPEGASSKADAKSDAKSSESSTKSSDSKSTDSKAGKSGDSGSKPKSGDSGSKSSAAAAS